MVKHKVDYILCLPGHPSSATQTNAVDMIIRKIRESGKTIEPIRAISSDVYNVRNMCLLQNGFRVDQQPFQGMFDYDRIIWIDSDNVPTFDDVEILISHDLDIVAGWYRKIDGNNIHDNNDTCCGKDDKRNNKIVPLKVKDVAFIVDLIEVDYAGFGLMVIKHGVFESLEFPWFRGETQQWNDAEGNLCERNVTDDLGFCRRVRSNGYKVYVDTKVFVGHEKRIII